MVDLSLHSLTFERFNLFLQRFENDKYQENLKLLRTKFKNIAKIIISYSVFKQTRSCKSVLAKNFMRETWNKQKSNDMWSMSFWDSKSFSVYIVYFSRIKSFFFHFWMFWMMAQTFINSHRFLMVQIGIGWLRRN